MSKPPRLNDAPVLDQVEGQYHKFLMLALWKYLPDGIEITLADILQFEADHGSDPWVLFSHGHKESFEFKAIRTNAAHVLAKHHAEKLEGRA